MSFKLFACLALIACSGTVSLALGKNAEQQIGPGYAPEFQLALRYLNQARLPNLR